jgi:hypothetical protein
VPGHGEACYGYIIVPTLDDKHEESRQRETHTERQTERDRQTERERERDREIRERQREQC